MYCIFAFLCVSPVSGSLVLDSLAGDWCMNESDAEFPLRMIDYTEARRTTASNHHELRGKRQNEMQNDISISPNSDKDK